ncbi:MAG: nucleoside triphosphate pyrophosphohydrolase [Clostridia bacterium]|nr:nucleoside triphosphate pyrophosphohydrolase [Clostridia bacterium]
MIQDFEFKDRYSCDDLMHIVSVLRGPGGCPWDAEQTHESIRSNFIEETYEVIEAINKKNDAMLREELGDVLLQVALHTVMAQERNAFTFDDVCNEICKKLILRHPHVFGDVQVSSSAEVLKNWDAIKMDSKHQKTASEAIDAVPREFPALMRAQKVQKKAAKVGFDWDDVSGALDKVQEETAEVRAALDTDPAQAPEEIGDLLFSVVNVCRFAGVDAEETLTAATDKFAARFKKTEALAAARGMDMKSAGLDALDALWEEVKKTGQ